MPGLAGMTAVANRIAEIVTDRAAEIIVVLLALAYMILVPF